MVPETGEPPIAAGETGEHGLWKLCRGLLRLTPEVRVEQGRMGEERRQHKELR